MSWKDNMQLKNGTTIKKRHFYNGREYTMDYENKIVRLSPEFHNKLLSETLWGRFGFKKVGGSSLGNLLGTNTWGSKFSESIRIMWLQPPMFDEKYVVAGQAIEPKVVDVIKQAKRGSVIDVFDPVQYNYDYFKTHPYIGGLPDAADMAGGRVYEIKTTGKKNLEKWDQYGVPEYYRQQVALYDLLMFKKDRSIDKTNCPKIVACFLEPQDYVNPDGLNIKERKIKTWDVVYPKSEIQKWMQTSKTFRDAIVHSGMSYHWDESKDKDLISFLECKNEDEYMKWLKEKGHL